jgi:hypothetical protein
MLVWLGTARRGWWLGGSGKGARLHPSACHRCTRAHERERERFGLVGGGAMRAGGAGGLQV